VSRKRLTAVAEKSELCAALSPVGAISRLIVLTIGAD